MARSIDEIIKFDVSLNTEAGGVSVTGDPNIYADSILNGAGLHIKDSRGGNITGVFRLTGFITLGSNNANMRDSSGGKIITT